MHLAVLPAAARRLFAPIVPLLGCGQRHVFLGRHDVQEYSMESLYLPSFHTRTGTGRWLEIINRILLRNAIHAKRFLLYRKCDAISYKAKKAVQMENPFAQLLLFYKELILCLGCVFYKPVCDLGQTAYTMLRLTGTGQLVVLTVEVAHSCGNTLLFQYGEQLQTLLHRTTIVFVGMDEQSRGLHVLRIAQRRMPPHLLNALFRINVCPHLALAEVESDIRYSVEGDPVGNRTLGCDCCKTIGVA